MNSRSLTCKLTHVAWVLTLVSWCSVLEAGVGVGESANFPIDTRIHIGRGESALFSINTVGALSVHSDSFGLFTIDTSGPDGVPPQITQQPQPLTVLEEAAAEFGVVASGTAPLSYQWRKDGVILPGAISSSFTLANVQASQEGAYDVVVSNVSGTVTSSVARLTVILTGETVRFGQAIVPAASLGVKLDVKPALINPPNRAVFIEGTNRVFAAAPGAVSISWLRADGTTNSPVQYIVDATPARTPPMALYHTHLSASTLTNFTPSATGVPAVTISNLKVRFHWNDAIPERVIANGITNHYLLHNPNNNQLMAAEKTGLILLEFQDSANVFLGLEVVQLRSPSEVSGSSAIDIGSQLQPRNSVPDPVKPFVAKGVSLQTPSEAFVYQHLDSASPQHGQIFAIKKTQFESDIEVYWRANGVLGIEWPYELSRYTATLIP